MELTKNFNLSEFECNCGCIMPEFVKENVKVLADNLQVLRDKVGPLRLTNAYRCPSHNSEVGGAKNSQHLLGKAGDVKSKSLEPSEIACITEDLMDSGEIVAGGVGRYNTFTHIDTRGITARWNNTTK